MDNPKYKIAVIGNYSYDHYEQALYEGFKKNGCDAYRIKCRYYKVWNIIGCFCNTVTIFRKTKLYKPDAIFLYRIESFFPSILFLISRIIGCKILIYHNDDPFNIQRRNRIKCIHYLHSIKYADITYVYRDINIKEAFSYKASKVKVLMPYYYTKYDNEKNAEFDISKKQKRIVFIGHYENDSRINYINELFRNNINLHIYGGDSWQPAFIQNTWPIDHLHPSVFGDKYRNILKYSYAALAFFSEKNRDQYTRRCFEIPMSGTLLIAPQTDVMRTLFSNKNNVILFTDKNDLTKKIKYLLIHNKEVESISVNGFNHVNSGNFSEVARAKSIIEDLKTLCQDE